MSFMVLVGTTPFGWDGLVRAVDAVADELGHVGIAQVGNGAYRPSALKSVRFMRHSEVVKQMEDVDLTILHGGLGSIGDALRHAQRFVVVPRDRGVGMRGRQEAPNDQWPVAERLGARYDFVCVRLAHLREGILTALASDAREPVSPPVTAHACIRDWLDTRGVKLS